MISELGRSGWIEKIALLAITVLAAQLHSGGAPERADVAGPGAVAAGVVLGTAIAAIVAARLFGWRLPLISSDRAAIVAVILIILVKVAIARIFLAV